MLKLRVTSFRSTGHVRTHIRWLLNRWFPLVASHEGGGPSITSSRLLQRISTYRSTHETQKTSKVLKVSLK